jgi:hypothetical protein
MADAIVHGANDPLDERGALLVEPLERVKGAGTRSNRSPRDGQPPNVKISDADSGEKRSGEADDDGEWDSEEDEHYENMSMYEQLIAARDDAEFVPEIGRLLAYSYQSNGCAYAI